MTATFKTANNEILGVFHGAWQNTGHPAVYENVAGQKPSGNSAPWARVRVRHTLGGQASLANVAGVRRWRRDGLLTVQIFTPLGEGTSEGYQLSKTVADAYEGVATDSGVWFRNVRLNEIGPGAEWFQINVLAEFMYDEVK